MTQQLSPSAQAVFDAAFPVYDDEILYVAPAKKHACMIAAAALRAAADQTAPEKQLEDIAYIHESYVDGMRDALACIEIIAEELQAQ